MRSFVVLDAEDDTELGWASFDGSLTVSGLAAAMIGGRVSAGQTERDAVNFYAAGWSNGHLLTRSTDITKTSQADEPQPAPQEPTPPDLRWPGWLLDTAIAAAVTAMLLEAMPGLNISALLDEFATWSRAYRPGDPMPDVRQWIANLPAGVCPDIASLITEAVQSAHTEGALVGQRSAEALLEHARAGGDVRAAVSHDVDWGDWTPGHPSAAQALLEPGGLERLLYQSRVIIKSIEANRYDQIGKILGEGLARGDSPQTLARALRELIDDPAWAHRIAITETNRAMSWASVIGYRQAGMQYKGWMTAFDQRVCRICYENEFEAPGVPRIVPIDELFPSGDPWPPAHPHCRCTPIPVIQFPNDITKGTWLEWNSSNPLHPKDARGRFALKAGIARAAKTWEKRLASGEVDERRLSTEQNMAHVDLVRFGDGTRAVFKRSKSPSTVAKGEFDAEELGAHVARALGLKPPDVHRSAEDEAYFSYVEDGRLGALFRSAEDVSAVKSVDGRRIGLLDALIENPDRNPGNWFLHEDGSITPIDHGVAWEAAQSVWGDGIDSGSAPWPSDFTRYLTGRPADGANPFTPHWADNELSPAYVSSLRPKLEALRSEFERLGHPDWHERMMTRLDIIEQHASGDVVL